MREKINYKKNKIVKLATALILGLVIMTGISTKTYAAPKQMPDGNIFDAGFYAATYPDVAAVLGTDETSIYTLPQDENRMNGYAGWQVSSGQAFVYTIQEAVFGSSATFNLYETGLEDWCKTYAKGRLHSSNSEPGWVPFGYYGQDNAINAKFEEYWNTLQPGDGLADGGHMSIVLMKTNDYVLVAEGNFNGEVNWGRKISKDLLRKSLQYVETPSW